MIKATLKHKRPRTHTKTEEIELPDNFDTGDIICVITEAIRNFDYVAEFIRNFDYNDHRLAFDTFEIALEDGTVYYCNEVVPNKYRLYEAGIDDEGEYYCCIADFMLRR